MRGREVERGVGVCGQVMVDGMSVIYKNTSRFDVTLDRTWNPQAPVAHTAICIATAYRSLSRYVTRLRRESCATQARQDLVGNERRPLARSAQLAPPARHPTFLHNFISTPILSHSHFLLFRPSAQHPSALHHMVAPASLAEETGEFPTYDDLSYLDFLVRPPVLPRCLRLTCLLPSSIFAPVVADHALSVDRLTAERPCHT